MAQKVLIIGGTGYIGKFIVQASAKAGHPTYALIRRSSLESPAKNRILNHFKSLGVNFLFGDLFDNESLVKAIKQVDVVISTLGGHMVPHQHKILSAIKQAGNVKRFFPSEFGNDADHIDAVEPAKSMYSAKAEFRRAVEAEGIPHTFVVCNFFDGYFLSNLSQPDASVPPRDKVVILGDGTPKVIYNKEEDVGTYTIRAIDDPRTLNKIMYLRPPANIYSTNDLVSLWERKIGKSLKRIYVPEEEVLKKIRETSYPLNIELALCHTAQVKGSQTNFDIEPSFGVEASALYPDVRYTTVEEYLDQAIFDNESLVEAIQQVDFVISTLHNQQLADQDKIVSAIKQAGNVKKYIGTYTIRAIEDPRTLNKIFYTRPLANIYSMNELFSLIEKKDDRKLEKFYNPEEEVLKNIQGWTIREINPTLILNQQLGLKL
ncbi:isoflavone reductase-like protein [Cucumis melo var. makuwa]|uniref:Isoflavone reductase-like protein n=1 Tax=Cucumis melo var. makuwa TaxID=1194695 RepID=A0A5A7TR10_CUCMM|nr:isoflavone reductase-like protein [Cucumis melo var. makuwa]